MADQEKQDFYDELELDRDASLNDIKIAYRKRSKETHPDVNKGQEEEFKRVAEAYEVLRDPEKRAYYDATGKVKDNQENKVDDFLTSVFLDLLEREMENEQSHNHINFPIVIVESIQASLKENEQRLRDLAKEEIKLMQVLDRFEEIPPNVVFRNTIHKSLNALEHEKERVKNTIILYEQAIEIVQKATYEYPEDFVTSQTSFLRFR